MLISVPQTPPLLYIHTHLSPNPKPTGCETPSTSCSKGQRSQTCAAIDLIRTIYNDHTLNHFEQNATTKASVHPAPTSSIKCCPAHDVQSLARPVWLLLAPHSFSRAATQVLAGSGVGGKIQSEGGVPCRKFSSISSAGGGGGGG